MVRGQETWGVVLRPCLWLPNMVYVGDAWAFHSIKSFYRPNLYQKQRKRLLRGGPARLVRPVVILIGFQGSFQFSLRDQTFEKDMFFLCMSRYIFADSQSEEKVRCLFWCAAWGLRMGCGVSFCGTSEALAKVDATTPEKTPSYGVNASLWPAWIVGQHHCVCSLVFTINMIQLRVI